MCSKQNTLPRQRHILAVLAICLGTALTIIDGAMANVALPAIARDLHIDGAEAVLIVTVYNLVLVMALLPLAAASDRIGLKRCYQAGQTVFTVATAACFLAHDLPTLLAIRALQALGGAASLSVMSALIRSIYPHEQLGRGLAINAFTVAVASALAPTAGGFILSLTAWPWIFAAGIPFALLSLLFGWRGLPDFPPSGMQHPYDNRGAGLTVATFGTLFLGLEALGQGAHLWFGIAASAVGLMLGTIFIRHELAQPHPVMPVDLLRSGRFAASLGAAFAFFTAMMLVLLSLPFRLEDQAHLSPSTVGLMMSSWPVTTMVLSPIAGVVADRFNAERLGGIGMAITALGMFFLAWMPVAPSFWDVAWRLSLTAVGSSIFMVPNTKLIIASAPHHRTAAAGGLQSTSRLVAQTMAASIVAALLANALGNGALPAGVGAVLCLIAAGLSAARPRAAVAATPKGTVQTPV